MSGKRKIRPARVLLLLLGLAFAAYVAICAVKFGADAVAAMSKNKDPDEERMIPTFEEYDGKLRDYNLAVLMADERTTSDQSMMMINADHLLAEDFEPDVAEYKETGLWFNSCMNAAFSDLAADVGELFGEKLYVSSGYRTAAEQQREVEEQGDVAQAVGASEHQVGLAADVYILYHAGMGLIETDAGKWINENCWQHGFIIRYPKYGEEKTGIGYEPWHIRYIGAPHAEYIMRNNLTLEDYYESLIPGVMYEISTEEGDYGVMRFFGGDLKAPKDFESAVVSDDNMGGHIATFLIKSRG